MDSPHYNIYLLLPHDFLPLLEKLFTDSTTSCAIECTCSFERYLANVRKMIPLQPLRKKTWFDSWPSVRWPPAKVCHSLVRASLSIPAVTEKEITVITIKQKVYNLLMAKTRNSKKEHKIQKKKRKSGCGRGRRKKVQREEKKREKTNCFPKIYSLKFILHLNFVWMVIKRLRNGGNISFPSPCMSFPYVVLNIWQTFPPFLILSYLSSFTKIK